MPGNPHIEKAVRLLDSVSGAGVALRTKVEKSDRGVKLWQTTVAFAAALAAGLSGYNASGKVSPEWLLVISIIIAIAGVLGNISNIWKVQEKANDYRDRYDQCRSLRNDIEAKLRTAYTLDPAKEGEIGALLIPFNQDAENRLSFLTDEYARPPTTGGKNVVLTSA
jgi:hypothetical protein